MKITTFHLCSRSLCSQDFADDAGATVVRSLKLVLNNIANVFTSVLHNMRRKTDEVNIFRPGDVTSRVFISEASCQAGTRTPFPALPANFEGAAV